jgi:hypothetical protein
MEFFVCAAWLLPEGGVRVEKISTHDKDKCAGRHCVIHNPSDHHMRAWRLHWRDEVALMERICEHGVGHPDPDHLAFVKNNWQDVHGCCGCCKGK